jgi:hypothetical protein
MQILPFDRYAIQTSLEIPELVERLREHVAARRIVRWSPTRSRFEGTVDDKGFKIRPIVPFQTILLPEMHGAFQPSGEGGTVSIEVTPSPVILRVVFLLSILLAVLVFVGELALVFLTVAAVMVLCWFLSMAGFWITGDAPRKTLAAIFDADC